MFQINDTISYGTDGVCTITGITSMTRKGKTQEYYVLKPAQGSQSTIYVPTGSETLQKKMRPVLTKEEVRRMVHSMPEQELMWIENENERKQTYTRLLQSGDHVALIRIIKTLYQRQQEMKKAGRKFHVSDERFLREAERILYNEFAHVLELEQNQVLPFILEQLEGTEAAQRTDS